MYELKAFASLPTVKMWLARIGGVDHVVVPTTPPEKIFSTDPTARLTHAVAVLAHRVETLTNELKSSRQASNLENELSMTQQQLDGAVEALRVSDDMRESQRLDYEQELAGLQAKLKDSEERVHFLESQYKEMQESLPKWKVDASSSQSSQSSPSSKSTGKCSSTMTTDQSKWLSKQGAFKKDGVYGGDAALVAARMGRVDVLKVLHENGVSMVEPNNYGEMTAHVAAKEDQLETLQYLLSINVPLGMTTYNGQTPLNIATSYGRFECRKFLMSQK